MLSSKIYFPSVIVLTLFTGFWIFRSNKYLLRHNHIQNHSHTSHASAVGGIDQYTHHQLQVPISNSNSFEKPKITADDLIYNLSRNTVPIVNEEYKIIFFQVAKVASSEWTRFFMRLSNNPDWCSNKRIHDRDVSGLKYLTDFSKTDAQEMMMNTNDEWTKAIFVRNPKPRILSAFLDKSIKRKLRFRTVYCEHYSAKGGDLEDCKNNHKKFSWFLKNITTTLGDNVHWRSISSRIDEKWWPYINFVGNMDTISDDAKVLLQSIHSSVTGKSAWDAIGQSGWSDNERSCNSSITGEFLAQRDLRHTTRAHDKMLKYYTPELEKFVERQYADDLNNPYFQMDKIQLFRNQDRNQQK